jgi:1,2-diacylglycerol 3-beta-galactosyltransferase
VTKVDFIYFDAGGGHRSAAIALKTAVEQQGRPWEIRLVNLQEILHSLDVFRKVTGVRLEDIYNRMLASGWTIGSKYGLRFMHAIIRLYHRPTVRLLAQHWAQEETQPDIVVSLVPNFNRALFQSLERALPGVPFVTILTDFADFPPHFWIERQRQWLVCGTARAVEQARALGHSDDRILRATGMILRPKFYECEPMDRAEERRKVGLDPDKPTGLVLFGGHGSRVMLEIADSLKDRQLIFICGRNQPLAEKLRALRGNAPRFIEGFTSEVPYYMRLSDYFIGKPGPGSISEAVAMGLPVIVERNTWTLVQERYNAEWVEERGVGLVIENFRHIRGAVARVERELAQFKTAVASVENRAVFEIPTMLEKVLEVGPTAEVGETPGLQPAPRPATENFSAESHST